MFNQMYLVIEQNKLKNRFGGTVTTAILDALNRETDVKHQEYIYQVLSRFNVAVKVMDEIFEISPTDEEWADYKDEYHDMYINILLNNLNKLYFRFGKINFMEEFSQVYWKQTQEFILQLWKELPEGKSVAANEASFIKIFDDLVNGTMEAFPDFMVKQLKEFQNLYRASRYEVFNNYKYIIPDPAYCHDNRWNDDGVAFLYLSYDNECQDYQKIKLAQKTCFEEVRAKNGEQLSVCKFKAVHKRVKILDLSYDGIDYDEQLEELEESGHDYKEKMMKVLQDKPKLKNRVVSHVKNKDEESFRAELERVQKKLGLDRKIQRKVQLQLSKILIGNICDSIFYAVDKEDDPKLEAYIPFRAFSRYLMAKGFGGVAYRSTRMALIGLQGKCITLFNVEDATYVEGEMEVYEYQQDGCKFIKKY